MKLILIILLILSIFIFNKIYFWNNKSVIFYNYIKKFFYFSIILINIFFLIIFISGFKIYLDSNFIISLLLLYMFIFICLFLSITLKGYQSPTEIIYEQIKDNNYISYKKLLIIIKSKKLISIRIKDLQKQKLIIQYKKSIQMTKFGEKLIIIFRYIHYHFILTKY